MDTLSEVLRAVALKGALFFNAEFSAPWSFRSPESRIVGAKLGAANERVIIFHLVVEGQAWAQLEGGVRVALKAGDIVIFPQGDPHLMGNGPPTEPVDNGKQLEKILAQGFNVSRSGGGGEVTKFVCGYMICQPQIGEIVLGALPSILTINIRDDAAGAWLENSLLFSAASTAASAAGSEAVLAKLSEALFVETIRRYTSTLPAATTGWLAGTRDPEVSKALGLLHQNPAQDWTIGSLATKVGVSRAVLAERFRHYIGEPPIGYLTRLRLQMGARLLQSSSDSVAEVALKVGYTSEAAFNRAFRRMFEVPPARFRNEARAARG